MYKIFDEQDLPIADLEKIGLVKDGSLILDDDDRLALLSGRRTAMLRLENLYADGFHIPALDTKLSLGLVQNGSLELRLHPIYKEAISPSWLSGAETQKLEKGYIQNLEKVVTGEDGNKKEVLVEFDKDTNEFIITDTGRLLAPDKVNNEALTDEQKERYRKGKIVALQDGTVLQYAAADPKGLRANRLQLIASIRVDGGVSHIFYNDLNAVFGGKHSLPMAQQQSKGFHEALAEMENSKQEQQLQQGHQQTGLYTRGYTRSGMSR